MLARVKNMKERILVDANGQELIVKHRKSAIFFESLADVEKPNSYSVKNANNCWGEQHKGYVCITELRRTYNFSDEDFKTFYEHCNLIAMESWSNFVPKEVDSLGADYDDYYDKDFDNNGTLSLKKNIMLIEGPYTQLKSNGDVIRLIKFNKRKFESFVYELNKLI